MKKEELVEVIKELYRLWNMNDTDEDIDFILSQVMRKINEESE